MSYPIWAAKWSEKYNNKTDNNEIMLVRDYLYKIDSDKDQKFIDKLYKMTWDVVLKKSIDWHDSLYKKLLDTLKHEGRAEDFIFFTQSGKMQWVCVNTGEGLEYEGNAMGHCVGGDYYVERVEGNQSIIFSLRDENLKPHITAEYDTTYKTFTQIRAKGNSYLPAKYKDNIIDLFNKVKPVSVPNGVLFDNLYINICHGTRIKNGIEEIGYYDIYEKKSFIFTNDNYYVERNEIGLFSLNKKNNQLLVSIQNADDRSFIINKIAEIINKHNYSTKVYMEDNDFFYDETNQTLYHMQDKDIPVFIKNDFKEIYTFLDGENSSSVICAYKNIFFSHKEKSNIDNIKFIGQHSETSLTKAFRKSLSMYKTDKEIRIECPVNSGMTHSKEKGIVPFFVDNIPSKIINNVSFNKINDIQFPEKTTFTSLNETSGSIYFKDINNIEFGKLQIEKGTNLFFNNCSGTIVLPKKVKGSKINVFITDCDAEFILGDNPNMIASIHIVNSNNSFFTGNFSNFYHSIQISLSDCAYFNKTRITIDEFKEKFMKEDNTYQQNKM